MKKRILSLALALVLCLGLASTASAYDDMGKAGEYNIISAGADFTAAIDENGSLWMWGTNGYGQLGNGNDTVGWYTSSTTVPVKVLDNVATVSCGAFHTAAIKTDGSLWMWGLSTYGQLGNGGVGNKKDEYNACQTIPVRVLNDVAAVSCGGNRTAVIKKDGSLWTWGDVPNKGSAFPVKVMDNVAAVSCGTDHTAAIKADGTLWMLGHNSCGQLGNGTKINSDIPVKVMDDVAAVNCKGFCTAAIKADGSLWMWGDNISSQLGNGGGGNEKSSRGVCQTVPTKVLDDVAAVSCGNSSTAAIKTDGSLWMWGSNEYSKLGNGGVGNGTYIPLSFSYSVPMQTVPVKVMDDVAAVSLGNRHTIAVKTDRTLWTWGSNHYGALGYPDGNDMTPQPGAYYIQTYPRQVEGIIMPKGVRLFLDGGMGGGKLWTDSAGSISVPTNPTKEGYTFGGWYTDPALTIPWNFNDKVVNTLVLYAKWVPVSSTASTTDKSQSVITLNGGKVTLDAYTLKAENGGDVTYVKLRDVAALLDGTKAKFNVDWRRGAIYVDTGKAYTTKNGTELKRISGTDGSYKWNTAPVLFDGETRALEGIVITDGQGGGHTFFKLRDLGQAIGFTVGWSAQQGIYIETD